MHRSTLVSLGALLLAAAVGCSGGDQWSADRPKVVPAEGVVTYKGDPVDGATVVFAPEDGQDAASAITDSRGRFSMSAFPNSSGAVPGRYKVIVTKREAVQAAPADPAQHDDETAAPPPKNLLPESYATAETSDLTVEVPAEGKKDIELTLTD